MGVGGGFTGMMGSDFPPTDEARHQGTGGVGGGLEDKTEERGRTEEAAPNCGSDGFTIEADYRRFQHNWVNSLLPSPVLTTRDISPGCGTGLERGTGLRTGTCCISNDVIEPSQG